MNAWRLSTLISCKYGSRSKKVAGFTTFVKPFLCMNEIKTIQSIKQQSLYINKTALWKSKKLLEKEEEMLLHLLYGVVMLFSQWV